MHVGFIDHEKTDVMDAARAKGCSDVMAKGQFANALPKLLASIAGNRLPPRYSADGGLGLRRRDAASHILGMVCPWPA